MERWGIVQLSVLAAALQAVSRAVAFVWRCCRRVLLWVAGLILGATAVGSVGSLAGADDLRSAFGSLMGLLVTGLAVWVIAFRAEHRERVSDEWQVHLVRNKARRC
mgnify:CR=1 FL=1